MADDSEWLKLPTEEKCQHKVWKARVAGYEEATKLFNGLDAKSPEFSKYAGHIKKFVIDSNAVAQEKGLDAVVAFCENAPNNLLARICNDVVNGAITKCLNASKQKTKEKGMEIIMLLIEAEKPDIVQECLMTGMENKQPKIVFGSVQTITMALRDFGTKVISVKPLLKLLPKLLDDRDKTVREETKALVIELYRWIGAALKPQMTNFKPIQVQELEAEFEKLPKEKPQQSRFMRSQQDLKAKMEQAAPSDTGAGDGADDVEEEEAIDPYDLMSAVDILAQLPKNFYEQIEAKKWQERKEALEAVQKLSQSPKIENGDFGNLIRALLKVVAKDTNVMLVVIAGKAIAGIAVGLRKKFQPYASQCVSTILEKFKEKKVTVVQALREAIDASYQAINLEVIAEDTIASLENKNPSIKSEAALFLARCFSRCTQTSLPKKILKMFVAPLLKTAADTAPEVREASFEALGTAMKVVSEKNVAPFLVDVDNLKMQKIKEWCEKAVLVNAKGEPRSVGGGGGDKVAKPTAGSAAPKPVKKPSNPGNAKKPPAKPTANKAKPQSGGKKPSSKKAAVEEKLESVLADETVEERAQEFLQSETMTNLLSSNWKERLSAMENFVKVVSSTARDEIPCQVCVRTLNKKPGLKDTNFQVLKLKLELLAHLARNAKFSKRSAEFCITDVVDKLGDAKNGSAAKDSLTAISEAIGLEYVSLEVISRAFEQKNPKNQQESLVWLNTAIQEFGLKVSVKALIPVVNKALAATNPGVRIAAISLLGTMYMYMGAKLRIFFEKEKAALLQQIDAEFDKVKDQSPPAPVRRMIGEQSSEVASDDNEADEAETEAAIEDLVPRNDISEKITETLLEEVADKNWKVRAEGLQKITTILSDAKFVTPSLGGLPEALKARLGDSNKNLQMTTITICQTLATALGPHCKGHFKVVGPGLMTCLGDSKPALREKVIACLNVWLENSSLLPLVESEALYDALKVENPNLRSELLGWLSEKLPNHKQLPAELKASIPLVLNCLGDRNSDVRKRATDALVPFMIHTGYDAFLKALGKCKPASKDQIQPLLEKARGNLPAKPVKTKASPVESKNEPPRSAPTRATDEDNVNQEDKKSSAKAEPKKVVKGRGKSAPPTSKKKAVEEEDTGPVISVTVSKEQRIKEEKQMKVLKWNFIELRSEFVEQLRSQMEKNFNKATMADLFHSDFKSHIKAIEQLTKCLETQEKETIANLDIILKWFTIRFFDTNPSMLNKALDYLQQLFTLLASEDYHLSDLEANSFVPYLILKSGDPKDNVRRDVRNIFKIMCKIYPSTKMFTFIIDGLKCKVAKQRTELLEELGCLIDDYGINVCQPSPAAALKLIAGQIGDRDNGVRNAALNTIVTAYCIIGDNVYKYAGNLKEKDLSYLEERIKRANKNKESKPTKDPLQPMQSQNLRPKTAPPSGGKIIKAASQPSLVKNQVKKTYQLDWEPEENEENVVLSLMEFDVDDVLAPIQKPKLKGSTTSQSSSPSSKVSSSSADLSASIGMVVSQINGIDINTSIKALAQIDEVLKSDRSLEDLANHVDNILVVIALQLKLGHSKYLPDPTVRNSDVICLYRCLIGTLLGIFEKSSMCRKASSKFLGDLMSSLLTTLLDSKVAQEEDGARVIRSVNVTVVKILSKSDPTNITCAMISLLRECLLSDTSTTAFLELVTKCLWKILNVVPDKINELNCDNILYEAHMFFETFPASTWNTPKLDMPIRTIKTLLHNLTMLKGHKILSHTGLIKASENSELEKYLHSVLSRGKFSTGNTSGNKSTISPNVKRVTKNHSQLSEIFKKIGTSEHYKEGLNELFDFKRTYPEADVEPFLNKTSSLFRSYINNMLSDIEKERKDKEEADNYSKSLDETTNASYTSEFPNPNSLMEKLKEIRAQCGLESNSVTSTEPKDTETHSSGTTLSSDPMSTDDVDLPLLSTRETSSSSEGNSKPSTDMASLKARLEKIKKMANS